MVRSLATAATGSGVRCVRDRDGPAAARDAAHRAVDPRDDLCGVRGQGGTAAARGRYRRRGLGQPHDRNRRDHRAGLGIRAGAGRGGTGRWVRGGRGPARRSQPGRGEQRQAGGVPASAADARAGVLRPAQRPVDHAVAVARLPVPRLAVGAGRPGGTGGAVGRVALPPCGHREPQARHLLDGHAGLARGCRGLRMVGVRDVPAGPQVLGERAAGACTRLGRRHLP